MRILIAEDDHIIAQQTQKALEREGHYVDWVENGDAAAEHAMINSYGLILLDIMMPVKDGLDACREIRRMGIDTPVLMLTARDTTDDVVTGLDAGADDYLIKPFDIRELLARIRAIGRRESAVKSQIIEIGDLRIDSHTHTCTRNGKPITLTPREFDLLLAMARNRDQVFSRQVILQRVWNEDESLENTVNFHVSSLRKKLDAGFETKLIHTVHGVGYVLRTPGSEM
ncbi:MAG: response regulator transcription factor [Armatimonadetes bacterium]|nr:response regulator transcription factor [Armatimonadota bacterium]